MKKTPIALTAALAGLLASAPLRADTAPKTPTDIAPSEKHGCSGKSGCSAKDKASCSAKEGCSAKDKKPADKEKSSCSAKEKKPVDKEKSACASKEGCGAKDKPKAN